MEDFCWTCLDEEDDKIAQYLLRTCKELQAYHLAYYGVGSSKTLST